MPSIRFLGVLRTRRSLESSRDVMKSRFSSYSALRRDTGGDGLSFPGFRMTYTGARFIVPGAPRHWQFPLDFPSTQLATSLPKPRRPESFASVDGGVWQNVIPSEQLSNQYQCPRPTWQHAPSSFAAVGWAASTHMRAFRPMPPAWIVLYRLSDNFAFRFGEPRRAASSGAGWSPDRT
jgi:hypothetical protein